METTALHPPSQPGVVLVVDDNEMNRDMLSRHLKRQGHQVAVAETGRQALEMIQAEPFDLVLLDILMPEMDGYEVLHHLKSDQTLRDIPVSGARVPTDGPRGLRPPAATSIGHAPDAGRARTAAGRRPRRRRAFILPMLSSVNSFITNPGPFGLCMDPLATRPAFLAKRRALTSH